MLKAPVTLSRFGRYVSLRFKMPRIMSFFVIILWSVRFATYILRFSTYCYVSPRFIGNSKPTFCYASLRVATYVLRFSTIYYVLLRFNTFRLRFSTFRLRSVTFDVRFDTFMLRISTLYYVLIKICEKVQEFAKSPH